MTSGQIEIGVSFVRPSQRTAQELADAQHQLSELEKQYLDANRAWTDAMRRGKDAAKPPKELAAAQRAFEQADRERHLAQNRIEELRGRLHDQRRRELLVEAIAGQDVAHGEMRRRAEESNQRRPFLRRLFGRR